MTSGGIEPATFRFVAQHLNQLSRRQQWKVRTSSYRLPDAAFVCLWPSLDLQSCKHDRNDRKVVAQFLDVCVAVKHFRRSEGIIQLCGVISIKRHDSVGLYACLCYPACKSSLFCRVLYYQPRHAGLYKNVSHYLINGTIFSEYVPNTKCVLIFSTNLSDICLILIRNEGYMLKNLYWSSRKISIVLIRF